VLATTPRPWLISISCIALARACARGVVSRSDFRFIVGEASLLW